jgi:hypothetical protein
MSRNLNPFLQSAKNDRFSQCSRQYRKTPRGGFLKLETERRPTLAGIQRIKRRGWFLKIAD